MLVGMDRGGNGFRCWLEWIEMGMCSDVGTDPKGVG